MEEQKRLSNIDVSRIVFNQITKKAVQDSLTAPRQINSQLVEAYLARRSLDYLVGFTLSPILWRKLPGSRSAGRVQSVALRLIVNREEEIERFITQEYWSIEGAFSGLNTPEKEHIASRLVEYNGEKLEKFSIPNSASAQEIRQDLEHKEYAIKDIERRQIKRSPAPPFITSTLQQEASRKLGFGASRTMQVAQKLYEGVSIGGEVQGLITYMRTDSTHMASEAISEIRDFLSKFYGPTYLPSAPRVFKTKAKNAQEAHECIRPTKISNRIKIYLLDI